MDWNYFVPSEEAIVSSFTLLQALLFRHLELHIVGTPRYEISVANLCCMSIDGYFSYADKKWSSGGSWTGFFASSFVDTWFWRRPMVSSLILQSKGSWILHSIHSMWLVDFHSTQIRLRSSLDSSRLLTLWFIGIIAVQADEFDPRYSTSTSVQNGRD